jgi:hypothetical protein
MLLISLSLLIAISIFLFITLTLHSSQLLYPLTLLVTESSNFSLVYQARTMTFAFLSLTIHSRHYETRLLNDEIMNSAHRSYSVCAASLTILMMLTTLNSLIHS